MQAASCIVPIHKKSSAAEGWYIFGTQKVFIELKQGNLTFKVGGGFLSGDEFIRNYLDKESSKIGDLTDEEAKKLFEGTKELKIKIQQPEMVNMPEPIP